MNFVFTEQSIQEVLDEKIELYKKLNQFIKKGTKVPDDKLPDYWPCYIPSVVQSRKVAVHAEMDEFPDDLFKEKAPNEDQAAFEYRKANYQPETVPYWWKGINQFSRIWNEQNYSLKGWEDTDANKQNPSEEYFLKQWPRYGSILSFFKSIVTPEKINYPNNLIGVKPSSIPMKPGDEGMERDLAGTIEPASYIYKSENVWDYSSEEWAVVLLYEKSIVKEADKDTRKGLIIEFWDTQYIWRATQKGKLSDYIFDITIWYEHKLDELPIKRLGGTPKYYEGYLYFWSIFTPAVPLLNKVIIDGNTLDALKALVGFPIRWEYSNECTRCDRDGNIVGTGGKKTICPECSGTHTVSKRSPFMVYQIPIQANNQIGPPLGEIKTPPLGYVEAPMNAPTFLDQQVDKNLTRAFSLLNIDVTDGTVTVQGDKTALGKQINREELFTTMLTFSNETFDLLEWNIRIGGNLRYSTYGAQGRVGEFEPPVINRPVTFIMRTPQDIIDEIAAAKEKGLPEIIMYRLVWEFLNTRFTSDKDQNAVIKLIMSADSIVNMDRAQIATGLGVGTIKDWQDDLHINAMRYIDEAIAGNPKFLELDIEVQKKEIIDRAKKESSIDKPIQADTAQSKTANAIR